MTTEERSGKLAVGIVGGAFSVFTAVLFPVSIAMQSLPLVLTAIICTFICWGWLWYLLGSRFRVLPTLNILWLAVGILLLGIASACMAFLRTEQHINSGDAAMVGFVMCVTGLSGLVSVAFGLVRLLAKAAKPTTSETPKQPPKEHPGAALYRELRDANDGQVPVVPLEIFPRSTSPEKSPPKKP